METRANYILVGLFALAVVVGSFAFVYWFNAPNGGSNASATRSCSTARCPA